MNKDNIPVSHGTLAILMELGAYQASRTFLGAAGYLFSFFLIHRSLGSLLPLLWLGLIINLIILIFVFTAMFSKKFSSILLDFISKTVGLFQRDRGAAFRKKALNGLQKYQKSAVIVAKNRKIYIFNAFITFLRIAAAHSAPFWIYKAFGLSGASFFEILAIQSVLYISCAALPFPGSVGIGESIFLLYYREIFPADALMTAMLMSRSIGVYFPIAFSGLSLLLILLINKFRVKTPAKELKNRLFPSGK